MNKPIPIEQFGRDHWSTFAFIETVIVDHRGIMDETRLQLMRCNPERHPHLEGFRSRTLGGRWKPEYATRLKGHTRDNPNTVPDHDDWDCADDLVAAGLLEDLGSGLNRRYGLTPYGVELASRLRMYKASGGSWSNFEYK